MEHLYVNESIDVNTSIYKEAYHLNTKAVGDYGEALAARFLTQKGWRILASQYRTRCGEIDIVAEKGGVLSFVEVKTRRGMAFGTPAQAVDARKRRRMERAALWYLSASGDERACRFDVVEVDLSDGGRPRLRHIENAFGMGE